MPNVIKCSHCEGVFFDIGDTICPYCRKDTKDGLEFLKDIFNLGE